MTKYEIGREISARRKKSFTCPLLAVRADTVSTKICPLFAVRADTGSTKMFVKLMLTKLNPTKIELIT